MSGGGMTLRAPVAERLGTRRPAAAARREYLLTLLAGAVGAAVVLLAARQGWARVVTVAPRPLPASRSTVSGQDLVPAAGALGAGRAGRPGRGARHPPASPAGWSAGCSPRSARPSPCP